MDLKEAALSCGRAARPFELGAGLPSGQTTARGPRNQWIHPCKGWGAGDGDPDGANRSHGGPFPPPKTRSLQPTDLLRGQAPPREATGP